MSTPSVARSEETPKKEGGRTSKVADEEQTRQAKAFTLCSVVVAVLWSLLPSSIKLMILACVGAGAYMAFQNGNLPFQTNANVVVYPAPQVQVPGRPMNAKRRSKDAASYTDRSTPVQKPTRRKSSDNNPEENLEKQFCDTDLAKMN